MAQFRVISIGTLAHNPLWGERGDVRPGHATTVLVEAGDATILVDPSLPEQILVPRLAERSGLKPDAVTHVFLTNFHPLRRRGLAAFDDAQWLVGELEREAIGAQLVGKYQEAEEAGDADLAASLRAEVALLQRCRAAPDRLAEGVDLFPLYGVTPGSCGLLLPQPSMTVLVAGDAVATSEHLAAGKVISPVFNLEQSQESFREAVEIADLIVCGRDNAVVNPLRR
ncbi:MAG: MBL fold metallo-hydrolase [Planctomycetes bacterium]|nr:MBL fold metallo-hydrolase [Planctomycetota bacterium]